MPTNCCVPLCTKKDKRDKETGEKISFSRFPEEENVKKQWIHAIRRDVGPNFSIRGYPEFVRGISGGKICREVSAEKLAPEQLL